MLVAIRPTAIVMVVVVPATSVSAEMRREIPVRVPHLTPAAICGPRRAAAATGSCRGRPEHHVVDDSVLLLGKVTARLRVAAGGGWVNHAPHNRPYRYLSRLWCVDESRSTYYMP